MKEQNIAGEVLIYLLAGIGVVAAGVMLLWIETENIKRIADADSNIDVMQQSQEGMSGYEVDTETNAETNIQTEAEGGNRAIIPKHLSCFQVTLSEYENPVEVQIVPEENSSFPAIHIRERGELEETLGIGDFEEHKDSTFESLQQVLFVDYDMDQDTDIIVFYTTVAGKQIQIFEGYDAERRLLRPGFKDMGFGARIAERIRESGMEVGERTFQEVVGYRYGEDYRFFSWQDAYRFVAGLEDILYGEMVCYDLIYVDENDVPELVVGNQTNPVVDLYTYEDGKVYRIIEDWRYRGYGAGRELMRDYLPRGNRIYSLDLYGGSMVYDEYIDSLDETHHLKTEADTSTVFSDGEKPGESKQEHFIGDRQITEAENREYLRDYYENKGQYKPIEGKYGYEEFAEVLAECERAVEDKEVYEAFLRGEITGIVSTGSTWKVYGKAYDGTSLTETGKNREYFYFDLDEDGKNELIVRTDDVRFAVLKRVKNELFVMFSSCELDYHVVKIGEMIGILNYFFYEGTPWPRESYSFRSFRQSDIIDGSWENSVYYERADKNSDGEWDMYLKGEFDSRPEIIDMATWEQETAVYQDAEWVEEWQTWE